MNKENAHLYLPLVQAFADGKTIQILASRRGCEDWEETISLDFSCAPDCYRIKPEPVMVPLGPEDVPPGSVLRKGCWPEHAWQMVVFAGTTHVTTGSNHLAYYSELMGDKWVIKRPGEDWKPCHKPA